MIFEVMESFINNRSSHGDSDTVYECFVARQAAVTTVLEINKYDDNYPQYIYIK